MADSCCDLGSQVQGYQCEFVGQVPSDYYCNECRHVARSITITGCCGETFCLSCIEVFQKEGKPCPACGAENFPTLQQVKYQKNIKNLEVCCSLRERGCTWQGPLEKLDNHLDPVEENCQFVDIKCPLNCGLLIPKNKVKHHVDNECAKRDFNCKYCGFKAIFEEVERHYSECKYVPLECPNRCGVTCEREDMEDHMRICRLEEIECKFKDLGCCEKFSREEMDGHIKEQGDKHLELASSLVIKNKKEFEKEIQELRVRFGDMEKSLTEKLQKQEEILQAQEQKFKEQKNILEEQKSSLESQFDELRKSYQDLVEKKLKEQEKKMQSKIDEHDDTIKKLESLIDNNKNNQEDKKLVQEQVKEIAVLKKSLKDQGEKLKKSEEKLKKQQKKLEDVEEERKKWQEDYQAQLKTRAEDKKDIDIRVKTIEGKLPKLMEMSNYLGNFERKFEMKNFTEEKEKDKPRDWKSPAMYTHMCGYKFCIGLDANGRGGSHGEAIYAELYVMPGEYDSLLKWPAKASFTLELINPGDGKNIKYSTAMKKWDKPEITYKCLSVFPFTEVNSSYCFLEHAKIDEFLVEDTLKFCTYVTLH